MSIVSSNMISKHYCPKCHSFDLFKLHRSFVEKRILGSQNKFQCRACEQVFKPSVFESNIPKEVPVFIDQIRQKAEAGETPKVAVQDPLVKKAVDELAVEEASVEKVDNISATVETTTVEVKQTAHSSLSKTSSQMMLNGDFMSEDNFKVTETVRPKTDEQKPVNKPKVRKAPPAHNNSQQYVDEPILTTEKKGVWPYVAGSAMVLLGAAYAFVWMPLISNAGTTDVTQMDMSIGSPGQVWSDSSLEAVSELPEVVELKESETVKKLVTDAADQLGSEAVPVKSEIQVKLEEIALGKELKNPEAVEQTKQAVLLAKTEIIAEAKEAIELKPSSESIDSKNKPAEVVINKPAKATTLTVKDYTLKHIIGTKADIALGGLSSDKPKQEKLPLSPPASSVIETDQSKITLEAESKVQVPLPDTSVRQYVVKPEKAAQPVLKAVTKPAVIKTVKADVKPRAPVVKKQSAVSDSEKLLERAAVKLMQQDLDKLF